jgi:tetraacyldisaccharide 4'-kinase
MIKDYPNLQCILLDDAFQHLAVSPGLHILLTEHSNPFTRDWLMPSGRLREGRSAYRRADIIIVSKCPDEMDTHDRYLLTQEIDPFPRQRVYFSRYRYHQLYNFLIPEERIDLQLKMNVLVVCAIAGTQYLVQHLREHVRSVRTLEYTDHHLFEEDDIDAIIKDFNLLPPENRIIITTEKDAMRLEAYADYIKMNHLPLYVLPVEVEFLDQDEQRFKQDIQHFLLNFMA